MTVTSLRLAVTNVGIKAFRDKMPFHTDPDATLSPEHKTRQIASYGTLSDLGEKSEILHHQEREWTA